MDLTYSITNVPIRLTEERWGHIINNKPYMHTYYEDVLRAVNEPTWILKGYAGSFVAVLSLGKNKYLHVIYKEVSKDDGFIITGFISRKINRSLIVWPEK